MINDDGLWYFRPQKNSHSVTKPGANINVSDQVQLRYYLLQCPIKSTTNMKSHKIPPPGKDYVCFQTDGRSARTAHYAKPRAFTKVVDKFFP